MKRATAFWTAILLSGVAAIPSGAVPGSPPAALPAEPGPRISARFEPWVDTRDPVFSRQQVSGFASLHSLAHPWPGEVVFTLPSGPAAGTWRDGPLEFRVETLPVDAKELVPPGLSPMAHYDRNPHLPLPAAQPFGAPHDRESVSFAPGGAPPEVRLPLRVATPVDAVLFVRWEVRARDRTIAGGILPDGFGHRSLSTSGTLDARAGAAASAQGGDDPSGGLPAGPGIVRAWPLLSHGDVSSILFDSAALDRAFGTGGAGADALARFAGRAGLFGIALRSASDAVDGSPERLAASAPPPARSPAIPLLDRRSVVGMRPRPTPFGETPVATKRGVSAGTSPEPEDPKRRPALVPDDLLGREVGPYGLATVLFIVAFCIGAAAILIRFFAFAKGSARMGVWRALPLWCAGSAALAVAVLPLALDRAPRVDVTEWRYGTDAGPEEVRIACGRGQSFESGPTTWTAPSDAWWIFDSWESADIRADPGAGAGARVCRPAKRGSGTSVRAARFAPRERVVSMSPDPEAGAERFRWVLGAAPEGGNAPAPSPEAREAFARLLRGWTSAASSNAVPVPGRSVTAGADFSGVWAWARGRWHALGPMKAGETRALDASQIVRQAMNVAGTRFRSVFDNAPFAVDGAWIETVAEAWLARDGDLASARTAHGGFESSPRPGGGGTTAPKPTEEFLEALDDAFVVAIRAPGEPEAPFLSAQFPSAGTPETTGRIVHVEVIR